MVYDKKVYMIRDRLTGSREGAYDRGYRTEYEFPSPDIARSSNVHDIFEDHDRYAIEEYQVTYTLINKDIN